MGYIGIMEKRRNLLKYDGVYRDNGKRNGIYYVAFRRIPPPCITGILGILEDTKIVTMILCSHYYRVGGPPKLSISNPYIIIGYCPHSPPLISFC